MSMEDFGTPRMSRGGSSESISRRNRRGGLGSPKKSMSIDSSMNQYTNQYSTGRADVNSIGIAGDAIQADTPLPQNQSNYPLVPSNGHHIQMYDEGQPVREPGSASGSPSKRVAFKGVPMIDHQTSRMLNGTPHHQPYPRMADLALASDDEVLAIDTDSRSFAHPVITAHSNFPAFINHNPETALEPYTGMVPISSTTHAPHHIGIPNTTSIRAITNETKSGITSSSTLTTVALTSSPSISQSGSTSTALPPIDYVPTQQQQFTIQQRQFNLTRDQQMQNFQPQQQYAMMQHQQQQHVIGEGGINGKRVTVLPSIMQLSNGNGPHDSGGGMILGYYFLHGNEIPVDNRIIPSFLD